MSAYSLSDIAVIDLAENGDGGFIVDKHNLTVHHVFVNEPPLHMFVPHYSKAVWEECLSIMLQDAAIDKGSRAATVMDAALMATQCITKAGAGY
jgi:hypothetical protein